MRRFKAIVSYDGHNYAGWQRQNNALGVQEVIEKVINMISKEDITIVSSGRTDAKVHALNQVFHFDSNFYLDAQGWYKAIKGYLPKDIYIRSIEEVDENFHARFSATSKEYYYLINIKEYDVFKANYAYYSKYELNIPYMIECSKIFIGEHDFTSFCANSLNTHPNQVRTIYDINFEIKDDLLKISFKGTGFLRYMVRMIVQTLILAGCGKLNREDIIKILDAKSKDACKWNAEPQGLYLYKVNY